MRLQGILILTCFALCACSTTQEDYQYYLQKKGVTAYNTDRFQHCFGYGCKEIANIDLSNKDWRELKKIFTPNSKNAIEERARVAQAIGLLETKVGAMTGTDEDRYGTFRKLGRLQLDCVDESTNTTIYLSLLKSKNLLRFHEIKPPSVRLPLINSGRWPHQSAVIKEVETDTAYVVDSWFHDNGFPAEIVSLEAWKDGWKPEHPKRNGDNEHKG